MIYGRIIKAGKRGDGLRANEKRQGTAAFHSAGDRVPNSERQGDMPIGNVLTSHPAGRKLATGFRQDTIKV
jgi:hypothetical protein